MDLNNTNQSENPTETPPQPTQQPINNQRGRFPIILGVLVLLLIVGAAAYYLGTQNNKNNYLSSSNQQPSALPTSIYQPSPTIIPTNSSSELEPIKKTAVTLGLTFSIPQGWYYAPEESCIYSYDPAKVGGRGGFAPGEYKFCLTEYSPDGTPKRNMTIAQLKQSLQNQAEKNTKLTEMTVNDLPILYYEYGQSDFVSNQPNTEAFIVSKNGYIGQFTNINPVIEADKYFQEVLKSFKSVN